MLDITIKTAPSDIFDLFITANHVHQHKTRFSSSGNFYVKTSRENKDRGSFARFDAKLWSIN